MLPALIALVGGAFLAFVAGDVAQVVWTLCHPDQAAVDAFPWLKDGSRSCLEDTSVNFSLGFNPARWLLYSACTSAALGAGALVSAWLLFREHRWGRRLWLTVCPLAILYFILFWALGGERAQLAGWLYAGTYGFALLLSSVLIARKRSTNAAP